MLTKLTHLIRKAPSIEAQTVDQRLHPHGIAIGDKQLRFSIPHNFSPDFPIKHMPQPVFLDDAAFEGTRVKRLPVWRAWWDFWTPGFFSQEIGTLMLSIDIYQTHFGFERDIFIRENLIEAIQINLINTYADHNREVIENGREDLEAHLPQHPKRYKDEIINNCRWLSYAVISDAGPDFYLGLSAPIDSGHYLCVSFHEPAHNTDFPQEYVASISRTVEIISETLALDLDTHEQGTGKGKPFTGYDHDLWPELWMETHSGELNGKIPAPPQRIARELHSKNID